VNARVTLPDGVTGVDGSGVAVAACVGTTVAVAVGGAGVGVAVAVGGGAVGVEVGWTCGACVGRVVGVASTTAVGVGEAVGVEAEAGWLVGLGVAVASSALSVPQETIARNRAALIAIKPGRAVPNHLKWTLISAPFVFFISPIRRIGGRRRYTRNRRNAMRFS
jgi:hypothetical protein